MNQNVAEILEGKNILLFDGYCNLCNSTVQFILKKEKKPSLYFCSLQSETGSAILNYFKIDPSQTDSLVLIENKQSYIKSTAALRVSKHLKGLYPMLFGFMIIPSFIRNMVYDFIARNRYKWYGKQDSCMMPEARWTGRFLL